MLTGLVAPVTVLADALPILISTVSLLPHPIAILVAARTLACGFRIAAAIALVFRTRALGRLAGFVRRLAALGPLRFVSR